MTIMAYDGQSLAIDKAIICGGVLAEGIKIHFIPSTPANSLEVVLATKMHQTEWFKNYLSLDEEARKAFVEPVRPFVFAFTGDVSMMIEIIDWFHDATKRKPMSRHRDESGILGLLLNPYDGLVYCLDGTLTATLVMRPPESFGYARDMCLGAMLAGSNATDAVMICLKNSTNVGLGIDTYHIPPELQQLRKDSLSKLFQARPVTQTFVTPQTVPPIPLS